MVKKITDFIAPALLILLLIQIWNITYNYQCYFSLIIPFIILVIISSSFIDIKIHERKCFRECFVEEKSLLSILLTSKFFIIIFFIILSILLTISILYSLLDFQPMMILYLTVFIVLLTFIYELIVRLLKNTISDSYLLVFAREIAILISTILSMAVYFYIILHSPTPEYLVSDFIETVRNASRLVDSKCIYMDYALRIKSELDGSFWWIIKYTADQIDSVFYRALIYTIFILYNSLILFGVNRFIIQIIYLKKKYEKGGVS